MNTQTQMKQVIDPATFEKKVQMEAAYLEYMDRMSPEGAMKEARKRVSEEFEVMRAG